jgi:hypothetical protein
MVMLRTPSDSAVADGVRFAGFELEVNEDANKLGLQSHCTSALDFLFNLLQ